MTAGKPRIAFVINSLEEGGAERVLSILLGKMEDRLADCEVFLVLLDRIEERYPVPGYVNKLTLDCRGAFGRSIVELTRALRRISPTVVMSFLARANCASIIAARVVGCPCIVSERVNPSSHFGSGVRAWINKSAFRLLYPRADRVLTVSRGVAQDLARNFAVPEGRIQVIYNAYDLDRMRAQAQAAPSVRVDGEYIVSVGRLVPNKNFPMLIRAYREAGIPEKLVILGEGPERAALVSLVADLGLEGRVLLPGFVGDAYAVMGRARFAAFSSNAEGFPNAMAECMALSVPVIATDCESGPAEILHDVVRAGVTGPLRADFGILVPVGDLGAMVTAIRWMSEDAEREHYRRRCAERIGTFSIANMVEQYLAALRSSSAA